MASKIVTFRDLNAWKKGHELVLMVYKITSGFPKRETYSLVDQMRRCAVSLTSNVAEGFSRKGKREKIQFYFMSLGSLTELQNQLIVARDVGYLKPSDYKQLFAQTIVVHKLINGLIKGAESRNT